MLAQRRRPRLVSPRKAPQLYLNHPLTTSRRIHRQIPALTVSPLDWTSSHNSLTSIALPSAPQRETGIHPQPRHSRSWSRVTHKVSSSDHRRRLTPWRRRSDQGSLVSGASSQGKEVRRPLIQSSRVRRGETERSGRSRRNTTLNTNTT